MMRKILALVIFFLCVTQAWSVDLDALQLDYKKYAKPYYEEVVKLVKLYWNKNLSDENVLDLFNAELLAGGVSYEESVIVTSLAYHILRNERILTLGGILAYLVGHMEEADTVYKIYQKYKANFTLEQKLHLAALISYRSEYTYYLETTRAKQGNTVNKTANPLATVDVQSNNSAGSAVPTDTSANPAPVSDTQSKQENTQATTDTVQNKADTQSGSTESSTPAAPATEVQKQQQ